MVVREEGVSRKRREGFFQGGGIFYVGGFLGAVDLAHEAGENFAGAYFDEVGCSFGDEELDALDPADGAGDLTDEAVGDFGAAMEEAGVDVGGDGEGRVVESDGFEGGG